MRCYLDPSCSYKYLYILAPLYIILLSSHQVVGQEHGQNQSHGQGVGAGRWSTIFGTQKDPHP